jgi:hypothetical protein
VQKQEARIGKAESHAEEGVVSPTPPMIAKYVSGHKKRKSSRGVKGMDRIL